MRILKDMNRPPFEELISLDVFNRYYSIARKLFGVNISLQPPGNSPGVVFGPRELFNPYCLAIQADSRGSRLCGSCDFLHQKECGKIKKPVAYTCHAGLTDFIIPITVEGTIIAYLQCGQVLAHKPTNKSWKLVLRGLSGLKIDLKSLKKYYFATRVLVPETRSGLIELLEVFANYVADAGNKLLLLRQKRTSQIVKMAQDFLQRNAERGMMLGEVAAAACTSQRNLTRVFRAETGLTPMTYLNRVRIEKVCEKLLADERKISDIAFDCGFETIQQFNRVFSSLKGCSPRQWRMRARRRRT